MLGSKWAFADTKKDFKGPLDVLNYALTLEYLEAEFYRQGNGHDLLERQGQGLPEDHPEGRGSPRLGAQGHHPRSSAATWRRRPEVGLRCGVQEQGVPTWPDRLHVREPRRAGLPRCGAVAVQGEGPAAGPQPASSASRLATQPSSASSPNQEGRGRRLPGTPSRPPPAEPRSSGQPDRSSSPPKPCRDKPHLRAAALGDERCARSRPCRSLAGLSG
ncbi:MAG: ferritin-like domain-containing protein [Hymenobacter sp.]